MCISHNIDKCILNKNFYQNPFIISKDIEKIKKIASIKGHNSVEKFEKIS